MRALKLVSVFAVGVLACACNRSQPNATQPDAAQSSTAPVDDSAAAQTALQSCDNLASDPSDPNRFAAGVTEAQMAPGAAIAACVKAKTLNPTVPRVAFELGRSYWVGHQDSAAFESLKDAATQNYAVAMKYIGDAFMEGRGLPNGYSQNFQTAIYWYTQAGQHGYPDAQPAIDEANKEILTHTFDRSVFQQPTYMYAMYTGDFSHIPDAPGLVYYVASVSTTLRSEKLLFVNSKCQPLITTANSIAITTANIAAYLSDATSGMHNNDNKSSSDTSSNDQSNDTGSQLGKLFGGLLTASIKSAYMTDQGEKDTIALINRYGCDGPIVESIVKNISAFSRNSDNAKG
jgi:TPR repeat protein